VAFAQETETPDLLARIVAAMPRGEDLGTIEVAFLNYLMMLLEPL
jgi:hypothetical protein